MNNISVNDYLNIIKKVKNSLKNDPVIIEMSSKYNFDPEDMDLIPVKFGDIDVSARTDKGVITLNYKLLESANFIDEIAKYLVHESDHYWAQSIEPTQSAEDGDYLSNPFEQDAFISQISYIDNHFGPQAAEDYTDQVLDHHNETGKERQEKKEILMEKVESLSNKFLQKVANYDLEQLLNKYLTSGDRTLWYIFLDALEEVDPITRNKLTSNSNKNLDVLVNTFPVIFKINENSVYSIIYEFNNPTNAIGYYNHNDEDIVEYEDCLVSIGKSSYKIDTVHFNDLQKIAGVSCKYLIRSFYTKSIVASAWALNNMDDEDRVVYEYEEDYQPLSDFMSQFENQAKQDIEILKNLFTI